MKPDQLHELARRQGGVFARWQARELGFSHETIARRVSSREWHVVLGCTLAAASSALTPASMEWAAYLACGRGAVLSGPSALRRHGADVDSRLVTNHWVTVPAERHVSFEQVRTIREAVDPADIVLIDGMRVTALGRSVVDTLRVVPRYLGQPILDRALLRDWITIRELESRTIALAGRRGVENLRHHLARVRGGARSEAERRLHGIIADVPGWVANYKVVDSQGNVLAILDAAFPEHRVGVEIDGLAFHVSPDRFQGDRIRGNDLTWLGWSMLHFTWDDLTQRGQDVRRRILRELAKQDPTLR